MNSMRRIKKVAIFIFALVATLLLPMGMLNFIAAEATLRHVTVYDQGETREFLTGASTVADAIQEAGIMLGASDRTNQALASPVWDGINITITRELAFNVQIDNSALLTRTAWPDTTVEQVLTQLQQEQNLSLLYGGNYDRTITAGETLNFASWRARNEVETLVLPYEVIENRTGAVWQGRSHVRQVGVPGEHTITTSVVYIGGTENNREVIDSMILLEPVDAVIDIGTAPLGALTDTSAPDFHYVRRVRMEATAYAAGYCCTGKHPDDPWYRITASGREVEHGIVAVDRTVIPLGTRLYVEGYGFALAADVGGAIRGYKIDLFMEDVQDALRFGRRHLYVWILD